MNRIWYYIFFSFSLFPACNTNGPEPVVRHATIEDFDEAKEVSAKITEGFTLDLWAPGPLLSNAVALTFDPSGAAYVAETVRRQSSDLDIRAHRDWMIDDIGLESLEDSRNFFMKVMDPSLSDQNLWLEDFNGDSIRDYRDLMVESEIVNKVWDSDGDGKADISRQYAVGFNDLLTGVAAGILHYDDQVFLAAAPDVWRLEDTNGDGIADSRESISHGYGIHIAYAGHDMSGLTLGVDGRIYWSIGDMGVNVTGPDGRNWKYPHEGAVMRCNPDGSDFEVFAHGLRNPQELAFDAYGNLISVDNDGDHAGEHERYVHIIEGSDSGWRMYWQYGKYSEPNEEYKVWMDEKLYLPHFPGQPAYIIPPLALAYDGPAGLAFNPGTALGNPWNDYFFASYFTGSSARSKIEAFQIAPKGSSFEIINNTDIIGGIVPTGITFAADGALYINDWKDSYSKKPEGRIWKMDVTESTKNQNRKQTSDILKAGMKKRDLQNLELLMANPDQRIRMNAQFEMVRRGKFDQLVQIALKNQDIFARLHAIWGISQIARAAQKDLSPISILLNDGNEHVRGQTAKIFGETQFTASEDGLINLLQDDFPSVQFFASEALGKIKSTKSFEFLVQHLEKTGEDDPHLRHAIVYALSRLASSKQLGELSDHTSVFVRIGAVVALRHQLSPDVRNFLNDQDELVLSETAKAIHDDVTIQEALSDLAQSLNKNVTTNEAFVRRAINANLRIGNAESAQRLAQFAVSGENIPMCLDALWALGYWSNPPKLDRVSGRYRNLSGHQLKEAQDAYKEAFPLLIQNKNKAIRLAGIETAGRLMQKEFAGEIEKIFTNNSDIDIKTTALTALGRLESENLVQLIDKTLSSRDIQLRLLAQDILGSLDQDESRTLPLFEKIISEKTWPEKQIALSALSKMKSEEAGEYLMLLFQKHMAGTLDKEIQLDLLNAIEKSAFDQVKKIKKTYETSIPKDEVLSKFSPSLYGGDAVNGRNIFYRNTAAQCIRCHAIDGRGGAVGPDLTRIASTLERTDILMSLVAPNNRIAPGYGTISFQLKNTEEEVIGVLVDENKEAVQVKVGDQTKEYLRTEIHNLELSPSAMFNSGEVLDQSQIRDVVAFLSTLK